MGSVRAGDVPCVDWFDGNVIPADMAMPIGQAFETVSVTADSRAPFERSRRTGRRARIESDRTERRPGERAVGQRAEPATTGVGRAARAHRSAASVSSHRFVKPLVIDQEASLSFRYRRK